MNVFNFINSPSLDIADTSVLSAEEHDENMAYINDYNDLVAGCTSLEHYVGTLSNISSVIDNVADEDITVNHLNSINALIESAEHFSLVRGSTFYSIGRLATSEEDSKHILTTESAEAVSDKVKAVINKFLAFLKACIIKIYELLRRLFANTDKLKRLAEATQKKVDTKFIPATGEKKAPAGLLIDGKFDAVAAVESFAKAFTLVTKYTDITLTEGRETLTTLKDNMTDEGIGKVKSNLSVSYGKDASDAKIIVHLGGNVNVGVGGGVLYTVNLKNEAIKFKALNKSQIESIIDTVLTEYNVIEKISGKVDVIKRNLDRMNSLIDNTARLADGIDKSKETVLRNMLHKAIAKTYAQSGIATIGRMGTLSYISCVDAIRACEWSMSGKAEK